MPDSTDFTLTPVRFVIIFLALLALAAFPGILSAQPMPEGEELEKTILKMEARSGQHQGIPDGRHRGYFEGPTYLSWHRQSG